MLRPIFCIDINTNIGRKFWLGTRTDNRKTRFNREWGESYGFIYPSIKSWNNPGDFSLPQNSASVIKSLHHHSEKYEPPINQKPATINSIIYKHSTHTKLCQHARGRSQPLG